MSDISFNEIPAGGEVRVPLTYIEFDNSNAVSGTPAPRQRVLMFGQRSMVEGKPVGTAAVNKPVRIYSKSQAAAAFGQGSMLHLMAKSFLAINRVAELWCLPQGDGTGSAEAATITLSGTATENGTLVTYVAGVRLPLSVLKDDTGAVLADSLAAQINANSDLPVTAEVMADGGGEDGDDSRAYVKLTAKFLGRSSLTDVRWNYYGQETTPGGVVASVAYPTGNNTNPSLDASIAAMGEQQYKFIVMPYLDEPSLNALRTELQDRWGPINQADGFAVTSYHGGLGDLTEFGISRNDQLICCFGSPATPQPQYLWCTSFCAVAAASLSIDPARPLQTLTVPGLMPPPLENRFTWSERNSLLFDGISTYTVDDGDQVTIERMITMYRTNKYGDSDPSYLDANTIATLSYLRYSLRLRIQQKYPRHKLADDGTIVAPGQPIVTPKIITAELLALFTEWETAGLVEDFDTYKDELYVTRNTSDKNRLDVLCGPNLINQFRIFAAQIRFIL